MDSAEKMRYTCYNDKCPAQEVVIVIEDKIYRIVQEILEATENVKFEYHYYRASWFRTSKRVSIK